MDRICLICRRRGCLEHTNILSEIYSRLDQIRTVKKEFSGSAVVPFIGSYGYPRINVGLLSPPKVTEDAWRMDAPEYWREMGYSLEQVISKRANLVNSRQSLSAKSIENGFIETCQEIATSKREVDSEFSLKKEPFLNVVNGRMPPILSSAQLEKVRTTENIRVPLAIDKVVNDELKTSEGVQKMYGDGISTSQISSILSVGLLGQGINKKIVPTRFSITATDDIIGKELIKQIKEFREISEFYLFHDFYIGNSYYIVFMPGEYSYELMEARLPDNNFGISRVQFHQDYEDYFLRKKYVEQTAGAFYAGRLAALEKLKMMKKQASILIIREIHPEYFFPVGIWQMRESVRKAVNSKGEKFASLKGVVSRLSEMMKISVNTVIVQSELLGRKRVQKRITGFVS